MSKNECGKIQTPGSQLTSIKSWALPPVYFTYFRGSIVFRSLLRGSFLVKAWTISTGGSASGLGLLITRKLIKNASKSHLTYPVFKGAEKSPAEVI